MQTKRLVLRRFEVVDAEAMFANWAHDPEVTRYLTWAPHKDVEETRKLLTDWVERYADPSWYQWAIVPKDLNEPVGAISVVETYPEIDGVEIGYCLGRPWWGRGYMTEAFSALITYFLSEVGALRIQAKHDVNNPASGRVMQKCGLRYEGTLRGYDVNNQGICDCCVYGLLACDR